MTDERAPEGADERRPRNRRRDDRVPGEAAGAERAGEARPRRDYGRAPRADRSARDASRDTRGERAPAARDRRTGERRSDERRPRPADDRRGGPRRGPEGDRREGSYPRRNAGDRPAPRGERGGFARRDEGPRSGGYGRREDAGSRGGYARRDDRPAGGAGPRGGFRPRRDDAGGPARRDDRGPRGGYARRDDRPTGPRGGYARRDDAGPRTGYPRRDDAGGPRGGYARRDDAAGSRGGYARRDDAGSPRAGYPRRDDAGASRGGYTRRDDAGGPRGGYARRDDSRGPRGGFARRDDRGPRAGDSRGPRTGYPRRDDRGPRAGDSRGPRTGYPRRDDRGPRAGYSRGPNGAARDPREARPFVHPNRDEAEERFLLPDDPREAALKILHAVDTRGVFSDRLLDGAHSREGWDPRDQALLHELVKGTLRWRGRIDAILDPLIHIGIDQVQPWIRNVLRLGAYQLLFLDRVPAHAAVDESVKLAHKYGHPGVAGLANSVLRRLAEEQDAIVVPEGEDVKSLAAWGSHPEWIVERWLERFGPEATRALMLANNRAVPVGLRVNTLKLDREALLAKLAEEGVTATPARFSPDLVWVESHHAPGALAAFKQGFCTAQDESESLVARLVAPEPHERLLDLCAAPGGKSTHLAELMGDEGEVWAMERDGARAQALEQTIARLGEHSIHVVHGDGRTYAFPMPFDRVLVDAPCSGLGVLGRRADARWRKGPEILEDMPPIQLDLLASAARRLRPGGVLVYSVCSFEPEETTVIVDRFLRAHPGFVLETAQGLLPDEVVDENGFMRVLPHVHGCDGAFAARFRKT